MMSATLNPHPRDAAIPAIINGVINGAIAWAGHKDRAAVPLTVDAISSTEATVGSEAAMIAPSAAAILVALFAAAVTVVVDTRTKRALLPEP